MGLFTDIQDLAQTARQAATDVAGTVLDVRRTQADIRTTRATQDAAIAQQRAYLVTSAPTPTNRQDLAAASGDSDPRNNTILLALGVLVVLMMLKGRG